jgi:hypothetical protein
LPSETTEVLAARYGSRYRWLATVTVMLGTVSAVLTTTTVNVAIPDIMGAFGIGQDRAQWLSTSALAAMTIGMAAQRVADQSLRPAADLHLGAFDIHCRPARGGHGAQRIRAHRLPRRSGRDRRRTPAPFDVHALSRIPATPAGERDGFLRR